MTFSLIITRAETYTLMCSLQQKGYVQEIFYTVYIERCQADKSNNIVEVCSLGEYDCAAVNE